MSFHLFCGFHSIFQNFLEKNRRKIKNAPNLFRKYRQIQKIFRHQKNFPFFGTVAKRLSATLSLPLFFHSCHRHFNCADANAKVLKVIVQAPQHLSFYFCFFCCNCKYSIFIRKLTIGFHTPPLLFFASFFLNIIFCFFFAYVFCEFEKKFQLFFCIFVFFICIFRFEMQKKMHRGYKSEKIQINVISFFHF